MAAMFDKGQDETIEQQVVLQFIHYIALWQNALSKNMSNADRKEFEKKTDELFQHIYSTYINFDMKQSLNMDWQCNLSEKHLFELFFTQYLNRLKKGEFRSEVNTPAAMKLKRQIVTEQKAIAALRGSMSYRIGHVLTWIPRKIRATFHIIRESGIKAVPVKVINRINIKKRKHEIVPESVPGFEILSVPAPLRNNVLSNVHNVITMQEAPQQSEAEWKAPSIDTDIENKDVAFLGTPYNADEPYVSVVLPTFNVAPYLDETIGTLQRQTMQNFEMIFVDDGSTDESINVIERYMKDDPRIKLIHQKNQFAGVARNNGMDHAKGRYVVCLDPDDFFDPALLELNYKKAEELSADIIVFGADVYNMQKKIFESAGFLRFSGRLPQNLAFTGEDILEDVFYLLNPWTKFYRSSFIAENNLRYQELYSTNDAYFTMMAMVLAKRIGALDGVLVHYRINRPGGLQETKARFPRNVYEAFDATKQDLIALGLYDKYQTPFLRKALESMFRSLDTIDDEAASRDFFEFLQREGWKSLGLDDCSPDLFSTNPHLKRYQRFTSIRHMGFEPYWANRP